MFEDEDDEDDDNEVDVRNLPIFKRVRKFRMWFAHLPN